MGHVLCCKYEGCEKTNLIFLALNIVMRGLQTYTNSCNDWMRMPKDRVCLAAVAAMLSVETKRFESFVHSRSW
jgi:hypothetical protein